MNNINNLINFCNKNQKNSELLYLFAQKDKFKDQNEVDYSSHELSVLFLEDIKETTLNLFKFFNQKNKTKEKKQKFEVNNQFEKYFNLSKCEDNSY